MDIIPLGSCIVKRQDLDPSMPPGSQPKLRQDTLALVNLLCHLRVRRGQASGVEAS